MVKQPFWLVEPCWIHIHGYIIPHYWWLNEDVWWLYALRFFHIAMEKLSIRWKDMVPYQNMKIKIAHSKPETNQRVNPPFPSVFHSFPVNPGLWRAQFETLLHPQATHLCFPCMVWRRGVTRTRWGWINYFPTGTTVDGGNPAPVGNYWEL